MEELTQICNEAHEKNIFTIIPKVEDAASLAVLWPLGAHYIQGFYLQAPTTELNFNFAESEF